MIPKTSVGYSDANIVSQGDALTLLKKDFEVDKIELSYFSIKDDEDSVLLLKKVHAHEFNIHSWFKNYNLLLEVHKNLKLEATQCVNFYFIT